MCLKTLVLIAVANFNHHIVFPHWRTSIKRKLKQQFPLVREPNADNCLDLIFVASPCEKVIIVRDTNFTIFAVRKFMLNMRNPGSFQNIGLLI